MGVYLFTYHAYRSWMPDKGRGFVQRGRGIMPADEGMAEGYRRRANYEQIRFTDEDCRMMLAEAQRVCGTPARKQTGWRLPICVAVFNHVHLLVSWRGFVSAKRARALLHRALTVVLRDAWGEADGRPILARGGSMKQVRDRPHFDHLLTTYLPGHRKYGGAILIPE